jgi:hypothetical protein
MQGRVLRQEVAQRIAMAAAYVTEMGDAGEVVGLQGFQHPGYVGAGVAAHSLIEHGAMARVLRVETDTRRSVCQTP